MSPVGPQYWILLGALFGLALAFVLSAGHRRPRRPRPAVRFGASWVQINNRTGEQEDLVMATTVPPGFNVRIQLTPLDADGQPTTIDLQDRPIRWSSSVPDVTVTPDETQFLALVTAPQGFRGTAQIQADADADLDAGEDRPILMLADLEYVGGEAQVLQGNVTLEPKA